MQALDLLGDFGRQRKRRLEQHPAASAPRQRRAAIEAKPRRRLDELTAAVDEVGNPKPPIAQIDRDLPSFAETQD